MAIRHTRTGGLGLALSRRRALGVGAIGIGASFLAACGGGGNESESSGSGAAAQPTTTGPAPAGPAAVATASADTPVRGGVMRKGTYLNVLGIDPHIEVSVGLYMMAYVYTYLGGYNPVDQKFSPIFAETLEQRSPTEFVFKLRKGVKFHDVAPVGGREVVAQDVLYSWERFRDLPKAQNNDYFKTVVDKMEAIDPYTIRLTTRKPWAESLLELGGIQKAIVPREAVEKFTDLSQNAIGAGPFMMDEYVKGERTILKRNPNYFDKNLPYLDGVKWITILDLSTLLQAYRTDQIDIGSGPYEGSQLTKLEWEDLRKSDKLVNVKMPSLSYSSLGLNASMKPFDDKRVRQALWVAFDRQEFIDKVGLGEGTAMGAISNGLNFWALSPEELKPYIAYDPKKAKDLFAAAGYPNGFEFDIDTSGGVPSYIQHTEVMIPELKKVGITAKAKLSDLPTYLSDKLFKGNFHSTIFSHNPYESPKIPLGFYHKDGIGSGSWWHYDNPQITAAIDAQNTEMDTNKRQKLVKDAQKLILEDGAPLINIFSRVDFRSWNKRVGGLDPAYRTFHYVRFSEYLKQG